MQFHVPQYIDVEDKIFGPFSAKQFFYIGGAVGAFFIFFSLTKSLFLGVLLSMPFVALGAALAFFKMNNQPFINILESAYKFIRGSRLYIWKKVPRKVVPGSADDDDLHDDVFVPKISDSKLKDLAWSLDIQESIYSSESQK